MSAAHSIVGELICAELDVRGGLSTLAMTLKQVSTGYSSQRIVALRSWPGSLAGMRHAREVHAQLRCGALYRVTADGLGVSPSTGSVVLLGVSDAQELKAAPPAWRAAPPANAMAAAGADIALALSLPASLQGHAR